MSGQEHTSAKSSHYDLEAPHYDAFNEENSKPVNKLIESLLRKYEVKTILDFTCGTGSQVFWLTSAGFKVVGVDINSKMLSIASEKARADDLIIEFIEGDMRSSKVRNFDAAITIFNAIGHLTKADFEQALCNIRDNLSVGGIYIFDIFNLNYLLWDNNITRMTIDNLVTSEGRAVREIQYSTINQAGVLASYDLLIEDANTQNPKETKAFQTLQVYTAQQLQDLLKSNGFKTLEQTAIDGQPFDDINTERLLIVAQRS